MDSDLVQALRSVCILSDVDDEVLTALAGRCRVVEFPQGQVVFREGDPGQTLYIIVSGAVRVVRSAGSDQPVHIADRIAGECIGEMALLDGLPRTADVTATEACRMIALDRADFLACLERSPRTLLSVLRCVATRLREADEAQRRQSSAAVSDRLTRILAEQARSRGE